MRHGDAGRRVLDEEGALTIRDRTVMAIVLGTACVPLVLGSAASPFFAGIAVVLAGWALVSFLNWRRTLRLRIASATRPSPVGRASGER
jgi:hypothetical protein